MQRRQGLEHPLLCLWPGLPDLWNGRFGGLVAALLFAGILQTAVVAWLIWPDLLSYSGQLVVCFGVSLYWMAFVVPQVLRRAEVSARISSPVSREHLFRIAQREYLRSNWFQAEQFLDQLLQQDPNDVEVRLYLATLYRRVHRYDEATRLVALLEADRLAKGWSDEIKHERRKLEQQVSLAGSLRAVDKERTDDSAAQDAA